MKITNRIVSQALYALSGALLSLPSWAQPITAYKVTQEGWGFLHAAKSIHEDKKRLCSDGLPNPSDPPEGEDVTSTVEETYYTYPALIRKTRITTYSLQVDSDNPDKRQVTCKLIKKVNEELIVFTNKRPCTINIKKRTARGGCPDVSHFIGPQPVEATRNRNTLAVNEGTQEIAGKKCVIQKSNLKSTLLQSCLVTEGLPLLRQQSGTLSIGGVVLAQQVWVQEPGKEVQVHEMKATAYEGPIQVDIKTIVPYLAGGYEIHRF
jgi:hypothetical protein